jgi:hypothetical protein
MAFQMHLAGPCVDSNALFKQLVSSLLFRWSLYETIASSLHHRTACRLWPKPDGTLDAIGRAVEYSSGAHWCDKRSQKPFRHRAARSELSVGADTAQRIWHRRLR